MSMAIPPSEKILAYHKRAYPNMFCLFYPGADKRRPPVAGIVLQVYDDALTLRPIGPDGMGPETPAIRHIEDERLAHKPQWRSAGAWDFTEGDKALITLVAKVSELEQRIAKIEGGGGQARKAAR